MEKIYGRKIIRDKHEYKHAGSDRNHYLKKFFLIVTIAFLVGALIGSTVTGLIMKNNYESQIEEIQEEPERK